MKKEKKRNEVLEGCLLYIGIFLVMLFIGRGCNFSGPSYPLDTSYMENYEYSADYADLYDDRNPYEVMYDNEPKTAEDREALCMIKGNITFDGEKIYHLPGMKYYDITVINKEYGERWFCSEDEAVRAGWRKSRE